MPYKIDDPKTWPEEWQKLPPEIGRQAVHVFNN